MKILLCHNRYQHRGGEDSVFDAEAQLLRDNGHEVSEFVKTNDSIGEKGSLQAAIGAIWASDAYRELRQRIREFQPGVVHIHNYMPRISPAAFFAARAEGVPVVQTLHNYRYICLTGMLMRQEKICEACVTKRIKWPGVVRHCYRDSVLASATVASMLSIHQLLGTWHNKVSRFIALTEFQKEKLIAGGYPANKIVLKPNFCPDPGQPTTPGQEKRRGLFIGRQSHEKGVDVLAKAVSGCDGDVDLVGSGPLLDWMRANAPANLHVHGYLPDEDVNRLKENALFLVLPSVVYEGFPMVIPEAFAMGLPVIAARHGGMREIIEDGHTGLHFNPGDPEDLSAKLQWAFANRDKMNEMGRNARQTYERSYTPAQNHKRLMEIYQDAISELK